MTDLFMSIFQEMDNSDRQLLLKFMCGRSRLQPGVEQWVNFQYAAAVRFPVGHTCGNSLDFPIFGEKEEMKKRLLIAIRLCGEIDDDGSYVDDNDDYHTKKKLGLIKLIAFFMTKALLEGGY